MLSARDWTCLLVSLCLCAGCMGTNSSDYHVVEDTSAQQPAAAPAEESAAPVPASVPGADQNSSAAQADAVSPAPVSRELPETAPAKPNSEATGSSTSRPEGGGAPTASAPPGGMPAVSPAAASALPGVPHEIKLLIPHKEFIAEGPEQALRVTFDDIDLLKVLNMEPVPPNAVDYLPGWLKDLDGKRIILRGWMFPSGRQEGITRFMFVRDNGICCFGREPKVYDKLAVTLRNGQSTRYIQGRPFDVVGTFTIEPDVEGDDIFWLYHLEDALVIEN